MRGRAARPCARPRATDLATRLKKYRLRAKVTIEDAGETLVVLAASASANKALVPAVHNNSNMNISQINAWKYYARECNTANKHL